MPDGVFGSYSIGINFIQVTTDDTATVVRKTVQPTSGNLAMNMPLIDGLPVGDVFTYPFVLSGGTPQVIDLLGLPLVDLVSKHFSNINVIFGMNTGAHSVRIGPAASEGWYGPYNFTTTGGGGGGGGDGFGDMPLGFMPDGFMPPGFMGPSGGGGGGGTIVPSGYEEVPPGEAVVHSYRTLGWPVDSTHHNFMIDPGANPGTFLLIFIGQQ